LKANHAAYSSVIASSASLNVRAIACLRAPQLRSHQRNFRAVVSVGGEDGQRTTESRYAGEPPGCMGVAAWGALRDFLSCDLKHAHSSVLLFNLICHQPSVGGRRRLSCSRKITPFLSTPTLKRAVTPTFKSLLAHGHALWRHPNAIRTWERNPAYVVAMADNPSRQS
jgi:hypothetical protein